MARNIVGVGPNNSDASMTLKGRKPVQPDSGSLSGTGNATITFDPAVTLVQVLNKGGSELTYEINNDSVTWAVGDNLGDEYADNAITQVEIVASGQWYVRAYR